jgi:uncharacterized protein GlcG (DUF336 family)
VITTHQVDNVVTAAKARAARLGVAVNIAVLDAGAHLKAFARMDGALLGSIDVAMHKARAAVMFECNSEAAWPRCKSLASAPMLMPANGGPAAFAGGIPLRAPDGAVIGAVGVSGGTVSQDVEIAQAAVAACRY